MSHINVNNDEVSEKEIGNEKKKKRGVDKRARSLRFFSVGSVIFIIAILLVVNLLFDSVFNGKLSWDLSSTKSNSIGDVSKGIVSNLNKDVEIVGLFELTTDTETQYKDFVPLLKDYAGKSNGHITVRYVDPVKYPSIVTELDPNNTVKATSGSFVVKCGNKIKQINPSDCFTYDEQTYYSTGNYVATSNNVEYNFTGAISAVTSDTVTKAYFTTNHTEDAHVQMNSLLTNNAVEVADLTTTGLDSIPADCSLLIIDNPQIDISTSDVTLLKTYLGSGGKLIVITGYESANLTFPNLNTVLHTMNLNITNSRISENDMSSRITATNGYMSYANVAKGTFSTSAYDKALVTAYNRAINVFDDPKTYITTEPVITTSTSAALEAGGDATKTGAAGTQNIAMYSSNSGGKVTSEALVIGTTYLSSDEYIEQYSLNATNVQFFNSMVTKMLGNENTVQVSVKQIPTYKFKSAPSANIQGFWSVVLIALIPLTFIIVAIVVYKKRKNM
jgi:hypothetical protein